MADPYAETHALLDERPEIEAAIEDVLTVNETGPWTFEEIEADSGTFGELVSRGIVEKTDSGSYRVVDPEAVRAAVAGDEHESMASSGTATDSTLSRITTRFQASFGGWTAALHRDLLVAIATVISFLFIFRTITFGQVFRADRVLLPGNDPYHYLYWVERLAEADPDPFAFSAIAETLGGRASGEPLVYTLGWWVTELAGGGVADAITIVAWLPVIAALIVGVGVYLVATWTTNDERVGIASLVVFALLPGHALYSGIGFFDHHSFDYVWLTLSIVGVAWLARDHELRDPHQRLNHLTSPATWGVVAALAVVFALMAHSWNGSPILLVGLAVYVTVRATSDLRAGWNPLVATTPIVVALGIGFGLAYLLHSRAGWQEPVAVYALLLVCLGAVVVSAAATVLQRVDVHPGVHLAVSALSVLPIWVVVTVVQPAVAARFLERIRGSLFGREGIAETRSLFAADYGVIFGPIDHFGWFLFLALPVVGWVGWRCLRSHEPRWLVPLSYASVLVTFALVQLRFAGESTPVVAVFAGLGVVHLLSVIDVAARPFPFEDRPERTRIQLQPPGVSRQQIGSALGIVLLVSSLSLFMVPAMMDNVAATDAEAEAIEWIDDHAAETDGPEYVLNDWGRNRMFNYAVNGESDSYGYAQRTYEPFISSSNPDSYADEFSGRVGYVVIDEVEAEAPATSGYAQLYEARGSATAAANGSGQFELVYTTPDGTVKVFQPVPGATITGEADPGATVSVQTNVTTAGETFTYERRTTASDNGTFVITVAHAGEYSVEGAVSNPNGTTISITDDAVDTGETYTF